MPVENVRRPVPGSYAEMFPGRFLRGEMLKGKKVLLTIKAIFGEDLTSSDDEQGKAEWIVQFVERPLEWVMNRSNAFCLYRMFGGNPQSWVGHKVVLFPQPGTWFGEKSEAIRIWGSPELAEDLPITLKFLRKKKDRNMTMHRTETAPTLVKPLANAPTPVSAPATTTVAIHPRLLEVFPLLGWGPTTCENWLTANAALNDDEKISKLESELDK